MRNSKANILANIKRRKEREARQAAQEEAEHQAYVARLATIGHTPESYSKQLHDTVMDGIERLAAAM